MTPRSATRARKTPRIRQAPHAPNDRADASPSGSYARIYAVVRRIPKGHVASYGQIAALAGLPRQARQVGYAMHALTSGTEVPWHRVLNARGETSIRANPDGRKLQRLLLEHEGVRFDANGRVALRKFWWRRALRTGGGRNPGR